MSKSVIDATKLSVEVLVRVGLLSLLVIYCLSIIFPFATPVIWGIVLAVALSPVYRFLLSLFKGKKKLTATLLCLILIGAMVIPSIVIADRVGTSLMVLASQVESGSLSIPEPQSKVNEWPFIGEKVYNIWSEAHANLEEFIVKYKENLKEVGKYLLGIVADLGKTIILFVLSIVLAGVLLATEGTRQFTEKFMVKLVGGDKGVEFVELSEKTILNVTKGILGVSVLQAAALSVVMLLAGVPYALLLGTIALVLAVVQVGPGLVSIIAIVYCYSTMSPVIATLWTIALIIVTLGDNVIKPMILGQGAPVPMLVIFLGSIGGFLVSGFLGLFVGAIVLSLGFKLFEAWIESE